MAAYDIHRHFKQLRVEPSRKRGRPDPFATGFEDDETDTTKKSSSKTKPSPLSQKPVSSPFSTATDEKRRTASPYVRPVNDSDDDDFSSYRPKRSVDRRASPAPLKLEERAPRAPRTLAVGNLAYLDDSEEEEKGKRRDRRPSPAPGKRSPGPPSPSINGRSPSATRERSGSAIPKHTVASAFAGTKYLQDSDTDSDEEAVASLRSNSQDSTADAPNGLLSPTDVKRVDKPKSSGSGVSWRAFSQGRTEQRASELQSLRQSLLKRGKSISFVSHVVTDDGQRIPLGQCCSNKGVRGRGRERSPPRSEKDIEPSKDEDVEEPTFTINPFSDNERTATPTGQLSLQTLSLQTDDRAAPRATFQLSESLNQSPVSELSDPMSPGKPAKLSVGPQTIPEGKHINHTLDEIEQPAQSLSRTSSGSRFRSMSRFGSMSRRHSRRSGSNVSDSPAHAFLSSWHRESGEPADPQPDDEGQAIGLRGEYIIGRSINGGGFGIVKEVSTRNDKTGQVESYAVKIVKKLSRPDEFDNDTIQQDLEHEVSVWRHLDHVHILKLRVVFETDYATFCIMDLNQGPTLHDIVRKQRQEGLAKGLEARLAKHYAFQLASALRYLHLDVKVCHRDVKLENCLIDNTNADYDINGGNLRLCDFGLADFLHSRSMDEERDLADSTGSLTDQSLASIIGTLEYASPKGLSVHRKLFETAGDIWAYGVIVYALCTGELPFKHSMPSKTVDAILRADWDSSALRQASTSGEGEEVYELVSGCLKKNIEDRWCIADCIDSFWFDTVREEESENEERIEEQKAWRQF